VAGIIILTNYNAPGTGSGDVELRVLFHQIQSNRKTNALNELDLSYFFLAEAQLTPRIS
jgi:hypothetical protein